jgi:methyl-accepting chemotaxis protein
MTQQNAALVEETNAALAVTEQQTQSLEALCSRFEFRTSSDEDDRRAA